MMNKSLNYFLVSKYGFSGEPPMKVKDPHDLIPQRRKINKNDPFSKNNERRSSLDDKSEEPKPLTKAELNMHTQGGLDLKYMTSKKQMKRFTRHLNHSFYNDLDPHLRKKHEQFVKLHNPVKKETVFDRLEKDRQSRDCSNGS